MVTILLVEIVNRYPLIVIRGHGGVCECMK